MGLDEKKGQMGKNIINLRTSTGNLNIHLLGIYPITIPSTFKGNDGLKMGVFVSFVTGKVYISTLLDSIRQSIHNIKQSLKLNLIVRDGSIYFRSKYQKRFPKSFTRNSHRFIKTSVQQMAHCDI